MITTRRCSRVAPDGVVVHKASLRSRLCAAIVRVCDAVQLSHRGAYSVEHLYAFDEYAQHVSKGRVGFVCFLAPLPALFTVILIETIPLDNPMHGWEHNYAYFVRCWVCSVVGTAALVLQVRNIFPDLAISTTEFFKIVFLTSGLCIAALIYTAGQWMFPVPAAMVVGLLPATALATSITFVIVGPKRIAQTSDVGNRVRRFAVLIVIKGLLPIIYGCFSSVYTTLASNHSSLAAQLVCSCTLPLTKHVLKHVLMRYATTRVDDYVPEIVVFSIDAFHVLYVCRCIVHTRTSPVFMTVCLVTLDLINHGISFCGIRRHTRTIQAFYVVPFFQRRCISSIATDILSHPERLDSRIFSSVRLRSCLKHRLSRQYVSHVAAPEPSPSQ